MRPRLPDPPPESHPVRVKVLSTAEMDGRKPKCKPRGKPFPKGHSGNPLGRKKHIGTTKRKAIAKGKRPRNVRRQLLERRAAAIAASGLTPLEFLLSVVRDVEIHLDYRIDAAKAASPYVHRKMPIAIEGGDPNKPIIFEASALTALQPAEKVMLLTLVEKMALAMQAPLDPRKALIDGVAKKVDAEDDKENSDADAD